MKTAEISKEQIKADLKTLGLKKGSHVAVALSFKSVGRVIGGPDAFIDAILEVIGPEGTLMMNAYTLIFPISEIDSDFVFDPASSVPYTGLVPRTLLKRKDSIRSTHPICSVAAIGKLAKYLTEGHDEKARNAFLPYERLAKIRGEYLSIGLKDRFVAIRHEAQRRAGLIVIPKFYGVMYKNSKGEIKLSVFQKPPCTLTQPKLIPHLVKKGVVKRGQIGLASSAIARADEFIDVLASLLRENPTLSLCNNFFCVDCRELERIFNLYSSIENPRFFQKSIMVRKILGFRNSLILKRYTAFSFKKSKRYGIPSLSYLLELGPSKILGLIRRKILKKQETNILA